MSGGHSCPCKKKGLIKVNYHDGTPFDLGVCTCPDGQRIRQRGPNALDLYALSYGIEAERVQLIEDLAEPDEIAALGVGPSTPAVDFMQAGKVAAKAHL